MIGEENSKPIFLGTKKAFCFSQNDSMIAIAQESDQILLADKHDLSKYTFISNDKTDRTISLTLTNTLLVRGGTQGTVTLWDSRQLGTKGPIHSFNRPGTKFKSFDISEHILAGGASKKIVFWDLRKMKQRCQFTESFNEDVTSLQFSKDQSTMLYAASYDGIIYKFDLTEKDEEQAFIWGHKITQSPCYIENNDNITLIQTQNQQIITLDEQSVKEKITANSVEEPTHILTSYLNKEKEACYFTKKMKSNIVQYWKGKKYIGYVPTNNIQIDMLIPLREKYVLFADQAGNWYSEQIHQGKQYKKRETNKDFMSVQQLQGESLSQVPKLINNSGFIISKPSTLKSNHKKFKPY